MGIPVDQMHENVKDRHLHDAQVWLEENDELHPVANRDAVRLAYVLWAAEEGNDDLYPAAVAKTVIPESEPTEEDVNNEADAPLIEPGDTEEPFEHPPEEEAV